MPLARVAQSAINFQEAIAIVRHRPTWFRRTARVVVYFRTAVAVSISGEDADAVLDWVQSLPTADTSLTGDVAVSIVTLNTQSPRREGRG